MRNKTLINTGLGLALTLFFFGVAKAQYGTIQFDNGITIAIKTETVPRNNSSSLGNIYSSNTTYSGSILHRVLTDTKNKIYFGYDVEIEKQGEPEKFKVSIKPLSKSPNQLILKNTTSVGNTPDYDSFTAQSLPKYPDAVILEDGDTITLDILENPQTGAKISDVIKITSKPKQFGNYFSEREKAKDFTIEDVLLRMERPDIYINEKEYKTGVSLVGNLNWIYIRGKGRFIFSFKPQPSYNFQKTGLIQNNKIQFEFNGDKYKFISKSPILGLGGKWNLWVMHDPGYQPTYSVTEEKPFVFGAAGKVEYLFEKQF